MAGSTWGQRPHHLASHLECMRRHSVKKWKYIYALLTGWYVIFLFWCEIHTYWPFWYESTLKSMNILILGETIAERLIILVPSNPCTIKIWYKNGMIFSHFGMKSSGSSV